MTWTYHNETLQLSWQPCYTAVNSADSEVFEIKMYLLTRSVAFSVLGGIFSFQKMCEVCFELRG